MSTLEKWDDLPAAEACARAWLDPGPQAGTWHKKAKAEIDYLMPLLARALDRLVLEVDVHPVDHRLWAWPVVDVAGDADDECRCGHLFKRHDAATYCRSKGCGCDRFAA